MIDLQAEQLEIVREILQQYVPEADVYVFGSRAAGKAKPHSDLDLLIRGKTMLPLQCVFRLEEAFTDSDLPFRVDVLDWHVISAEFRKNIMCCGEMIYSGVCV